MQTSALEGESSLVSLRFAVDVRTNSIIASGSLGDLSVIEAILLRLDDAEVRHRQSEVYLLKNAPAADVAAAITEFLSTEQSVLQNTPGVLGVFEQIEREVVVVAEPVRNALLISATPRFYDEVMALVTKLDEQPPMVVIQVLLAEVQLDNFQEFGVELGLQDSILFDRSLAGVTQDANGNPIAAAGAIPGFLFNNQQLGNNTAAPSGNTGGQALSTFGVGRTNSGLGYGGLVLSASSESVSVLIRALRECRRLEVLSRPQIMTLDNQPAQIQVGQQVSRVTGTSVNSNVQNTSVEDVDVGLILGVVPRITPDGLVVMEIRATKSELGSEAEGTPISVSVTGEILRSPPINITTAETTVATPDGQTVILGGLITKTKASTRRRIPFLSDIPIVRQLFRYDSDGVDRRELLIIMTPHVVRNREDAEAIKQVEAARMHWCLGDVIELHGEIGMRGEGDLWADSETVVVYPDLDPDATALPILGEPNENPFRSEMVPMPESEPGEEELAEPPTLQPTSGARQAVPRAMPPGAQSPMRQVEQARYFGPPTWGDVETAVYEDRDPRVRQLDYRHGVSQQGATGSVVPSAYQTPVVRRLPPVVQATTGSPSQPSVRTNPVRQNIPSAPLR